MMVYTYKEILKKYNGNRNKLKKDIRNKVIYKIEEGIYSSQKFVEELEIIFFKYKDAVLTLQSAFYYHGLSDYIPEKIVISTPKAAWNKKRKDIKQIFMKPEYHSIGVETKQNRGYSIKIYNLERTLIELIRYSDKLPYELYKEVINSYREIKNQLSYNKLVDYSNKFNSKSKIISAIENSIM